MLADHTQEAWFEIIEHIIEGKLVRRAVRLLCWPCGNACDCWPLKSRDEVAAWLRDPKNVEGRHEFKSVRAGVRHAGRKLCYFDGTVQRERHYINRVIMRAAFVPDFIGQIALHGEAENKALCHGHIDHPGAHKTCKSRDRSTHDSFI